MRARSDRPDPGDRRGRRIGLFPLARSADRRGGDRGSTAGILNGSTRIPVKQVEPAGGHALSRNSVVAVSLPKR
ncbi:hypothetical protein F8B43_5361 [Methylorubrum populi]|uniref:Uncharacterized protein n=1 Tax=Methylorubrum populi TaxID=223967 RepID=A0A833MWW5_9HYPH|nr:hypothetical protein F8B43_5361 [Methylorubrum populi]